MTWGVGWQEPNRNRRIVRDLKLRSIHCFEGFLCECFSTQTVDDVTALGTEIFGSDSDPRVKKLKVGKIPAITEVPIL